MAVLTKPKGYAYIIGNKGSKSVIDSKTTKQQWASIQKNSKTLKENNAILFSQYKKSKVVK